MKTICLSSRPLFVLVLLGWLAPSAAVERCDIIDNFANREGSIAVEGYGFEPSDGSTKLRTPMLGGTCQEGAVTMTAMSSEITSEVGDGVARRSINIYDNARSFTSRFRLNFAGGPAARQNTGFQFRELVFTPPNADVMGPPAQMRFVASTWDSGLSWTLSARLAYELNQRFYELEFGSVYLSAGTLPREFEMLLEYTQVYDANYGNWRPRLKLTHFRDGAVYQVRDSALPWGMKPVEQAQGLLGQSNVPPGMRFEVTNCDPNYCLPYSSPGKPSVD